VHPLLARRHLLGIYLAAWLLVGVLLAFLLAGTNSRLWPPAGALALPLALAFGLLGLASFYPCRANPLFGSLPRLAATHAGAALLTSTLWLGAGDLLARLLGRLGGALLDGGEAERLFADRRLFLFLLGLLLYLLAAGFHYLLLAFDEARAAGERAMELRALAREAELGALKAQIDPHFLFNSLNSLAALTSSDPKGARQMVLALASFLRASLAVGRREAIPLGEELALARSYLAIESFRFGERLKVTEGVDETLLGARVPPLVLLPLVENAVRHGIARRVEGGLIRLEARAEGGCLVVTVENPRESAATATTRPGTGLGLANVRRRLLLTYGKEGSLVVRREGEIFRAELRLPHEDAREEEIR